MAKPITGIKTYKLSKEDKVNKDLEEVKVAISDNKEAILKGIQLLKALDDGGTLDTAYAFTNAKHEALKNVVGELSKDQYTPILENLPELVFLLGDLDMKALRDVSNRLNEGLKGMEKVDDRSKTSFLDIAKALKDPEINRSMTMILQFLKGLGHK